MEMCDDLEGTHKITNSFRERDYTGIRGYEIKGETVEQRIQMTAAVHACTNAGKF